MKLQVLAATSTEMAETLNAVITDVGVLMEGMANGDYTIQSEHSGKYVGDFEQLLTAMRGMRDAMVHTIQMIGEASSQGFCRFHEPCRIFPEYGRRCY